MIGRITHGITQELALETVNFVLHQLPAWRDDPDRTKELSEPKLNLQLVKFLDSNARNFFPMVRFNHEEIQPERRSVDFSASPAEPMTIGAMYYSIYKPFLVFECKRLPAPSKDREIEYVTGGKQQKSGGIQRFKLGLHGSEIELVAMIGYIQDRSTGDWYLQINSWISELSNGVIEDCCKWEDSDKLQELKEDGKIGTASCLSFHNRTGNVASGGIKIHHLWIAMNFDKIKID